MLVLGVLWLLTSAWTSAHARVDAPGPASGDEVLALVAATVALGIAAWLCLGAALEVLAHAPGRVGRVARRCSDRLTPALARRVAAFVLGVGVGVAGGPSQAVAGGRFPMSSAAGSSTAAGSPTVADPAFLPAPAVASIRAAAAPADPGFGALAAPPPPTAPGVGAPHPGFAPTPVAPGFTPTAPRVRPQADAELLGARSHRAPEREVVVHRGDSLWSIAARHLGPDAGDAEVARAWPQWYAANRDVIGDDPDLVLPGQILRIPTPDQTGRVTR